MEYCSSESRLEKKRIKFSIHDASVCFILNFAFFGALRIFFTRLKGSREIAVKVFRERRTHGRDRCHCARMRARKFRNNGPGESMKLMKRQFVRCVTPGEYPWRIHRTRIGDAILFRLKGRRAIVIDHRGDTTTRTSSLVAPCSFINIVVKELNLCPI